MSVSRRSRNPPWGTSGGTPSPAGLSPVPSLLLPRVDPEADVLDAGLLSYLVQKNVERLEHSTPEARWQWYRLHSSLAPDLCRFPVSLPGNVQATSHATESVAPAPVESSASPGTFCAR